MPAQLPPTADCWFLSGPTASGKTAVGIALARRLDAEIVSMDSMAVYRGLDIGTAKPTAQERAAIAHHLLDIRWPDEEFSLAEYVAAAEEAVADIRRRGKQPLFVGGTPLYLKALLRGIFEGPPADWAFRQELLAEANRRPPGFLHARLAKVDPAAASRLHANDRRRLVRALEVYEKTGQPISHWQRQFESSRQAEACRVFVLDWPKELLQSRIEERVAGMLEAGLVREVEDQLARGGFGRTASQALGYREILDQLRGLHSLDEASGLIKLRTRQFAKRQGTWFRSLSECRFVRMSAVGKVDDVADELLSMLH